MNTNFSIILFLIYGLYLLKKYKQNLVSIFLFYFLAFWQLGSLKYIESGIYIMEQNNFSYKTGVTWRFFFSTIIYLIFIERFGLKKIAKQNINLIREKRDLKNIKIITIVILVIIFLMYINLFMTGIPLLSGNLNRFTYITNSKFKIIIYLSSYVSTYSFFLGIAASEEKDKRIICLFLLLLLYGVLIDQKFSYFIQTIPYYLFGFCLKKRMKIKFLFFPILLFLTFMLYKVNLEYSHYGGMGNNLYEKLITRIFGLQAHLFWGIDRLIKETKNYSNILELKNEISFIFGFNKDKYTTSIYEMMKKVAPENIYLTYFKNNIRFAGNQLATLIYYFNYKISFFIQIIFGIFLGIVIKKIYYYSNKKKYLELFFYFQIYQSLFLFYSMGIIIEFITKRLVLCLVALFILKIIKDLKKYRYKEREK